MKIFIIGPEASGKTIFATMLNYFIEHNNNSQLTFRASDIKTKKYFSNVYNTLEQGEWPKSTIQGTLNELNWEWLYDNKSTFVTLIDPPGQDIRKELNGDSNELDILNKISEADLLILIVDLYEHQEANNDKKNENAWIVEKTLSLVSENQSLIMAVSKADLLTQLPSHLWRNREEILPLFKQYMPEFNSSGYQNLLKGTDCSVIAFSSVLTENKQENGKLFRMPRKPITSQGFQHFSDCIFQALVKDKNIKEQIVINEKIAEECRVNDIFLAEKKKREGKILGWSLGIIGLIVLISLIYSASPNYLACPTCNGNGTTSSLIQCPDCLGQGKVKGECSSCKGKSPTWWLDSCSRCNSKGFLWYRCSKCNGAGQLKDTVKCSTCNGKGKVVSAK